MLDGPLGQLGHFANLRLQTLSITSPKIILWYNNIVIKIISIYSAGYRYEKLMAVTVSVIN